MIPVPSGVQVWVAVGRTDLRKGMNTRWRFKFRKRCIAIRMPATSMSSGVGRGDLIKILWHDGLGVMSLYREAAGEGPLHLAVWRRRGRDLGSSNT